MTRSWKACLLRDGQLAQNRQGVFVSRVQGQVATSAACAQVAHSTSQELLEHLSAGEISELSTWGAFSDSRGDALQLA